MKALLTLLVSAYKGEAFVYYVGLKKVCEVPNELLGSGVKLVVGNYTFKPISYDMDENYFELSCRDSTDAYSDGYLCEDVDLLDDFELVRVRFAEERLGEADREAAKELKKMGVVYEFNEETTIS